MATKKSLEDDRCFPNPHLEDPDCRASVKGRFELPDELGISLRRAIEVNLPLVDRPSQDHSVYTGSAGIALLHLHLATTIYHDDPTKHAHHLHSALSLLTPSHRHPSTHRITFMCGAAGPLALSCVIHAHLGHTEAANTCARELTELYTNHKAFSSQPSELLTGHAGYIYALLFVNSHIPQTIGDDFIAKVVTLLLDVGERGRKGSASPLMYTWHDKHYLGAAHGLAGILTLLLQVQIPALHTRIMSLVRPCVDYLVSLQFPSGNFPSSLENSHSDRLVHWCHGAPGFVHLMALAYREFKDEQYLQAAVACGDVVWQRGLLRKGYGLCHGVAGNAYTFLQLYRLTEKLEYMHRAVKFARWCLSSSERETRIPDRPLSLFEGVAGTLYFYADLLRDPINATFPALELPVTVAPSSTLDPTQSLS